MPCTSLGYFIGIKPDGLVILQPLGRQARHGM
jgi:hypothetical protein